MLLLPFAYSPQKGRGVSRIHPIKGPVSRIHESKWPKGTILRIDRYVFLALTQKLRTTLPFLICVRKTSGKVTEQIQSKYYLGSLSNIVGNSIGFQLYLLLYIWRNICPELIPWSIYLSASVLLLVCTGLAKFISHPVWGENKPLFDRVLGQTKALITTTVLSSVKGIAFFLKGTQQEMSPIDGVLLWVR